jgi:hypothetical protein
MESKLRLYEENHNVIWPEKLYMSVVWESNPQLFYIGMGSYRLSQIVADVQGYFVKSVIEGKYVLPLDLKNNKSESDIKRSS